MTEILIRFSAVLALLVILFVGEQYIERRGYDRAMSEAQVEIESSKRAAAERLAFEGARTRKVEQALQDTTNSQNLKDANHEKTVADLHDQLRRAAGPTGRLRDPHASRCGAGSGGATSEATTATGDRPGDPAETSGLLSAELTGLLQRLQSEADTINDAYASCRADAYTVRSSQP